MAGEAAEGDKGSTIARIAAAAALVLAIVLAAVAARRRRLLVRGHRALPERRPARQGQPRPGRRASRSALVKSIELADDGHAEVELEIDDEVAPLRRGTQATLRIASLSGVANRYVDLEHAARRGAGGDPRRRRDPGRGHDDGGRPRPALRAVRRAHEARACATSSAASAPPTRTASSEANAGWEYLNPSLVAPRRLFEELTYDERALQRFLVSNSKLVTDLAERGDDLAHARRPARRDVRRDRARSGPR